ncbi:MAG: phosphoribosylformylglycinamidine synthase subunit PurS [Bacteroidetes bacterium]|nr:MAG: phosphoribosylformylglycinamidine synthase subunit PurS [Bacteroidota bacterium]
MKYVAEIDVMPRKELLDPQGKTVARNMKNVGVEGVEDVRIGKHIRMVVEAADEAEARQKVETACDKLLANVIMETYTYQLHPAE